MLQWVEPGLYDALAERNATWRPRPNGIAVDIAPLAGLDARFLGLHWSASPTGPTVQIRHQGPTLSLSVQGTANPYARDLARQFLTDATAATPDEVDAWVDGLAGDAYATPEPTIWSVDVPNTIPLRLGELLRNATASSPPPSPGTRYLALEPWWLEVEVQVVEWHAPVDPGANQTALVLRVDRGDAAHAELPGRSEAEPLGNLTREATTRLQGEGLPHARAGEATLVGWGCG